MKTSSRLILLVCSRCIAYSDFCRMRTYILISVIGLLISIFYHTYFSKPISIVDRPETHYDYIVVGAGTCGCVIASRLSEKSNVTVLLVEAGGYFNWLSTIPLAAPVMQGTEVDWAYKTEHQKFSSKGLWNRKQSWPRGKGLGGTGQINYLLHSFGRPEDYKTWPKEWSHAALLPYFKKVFDILNVMTFYSDEPLANAFADAETDLHAHNVTLQKASLTSKRGARWSTYHAYLQQAWNRRNMHVLVNTLVTKVTFDGKKATGIKVMYDDGSHEKIQAKKDVILCAGTVNTPQLLLLSGVGPSADLKKHGIRIVHDLPDVGRNLFDHMNVPVYVSLKEPVSITIRKMQTVPQVLRYLVYGDGHLGSNGVMGTGRVNNSGIILFGIASTDERLLKDIANFQTEIFRSLFPAYNDTTYEGFLYLAACLQPKSRGTITLKSKNIFYPPKIDPAYLEHDDDVICTYEAINLALQTLDTQHFRKLGATVHAPDFEECRHLRQDYRDVVYAECVMRIAGLTSYHPGGTCKMSTDNDGVVDETLRVKGVTGVRIMDASVLPSPISGTPNSVLVAMAERASDIILNYDID